MSSRSKDFESGILLVVYPFDWLCENHKQCAISMRWPKYYLRAFEKESKTEGEYRTMDFIKIPHFDKKM